MLSASSPIPNNETDAQGCCPCFNLSVSIDQFDIKLESFYINEKVQGQ